MEDVLIALFWFVPPIAGAVLGGRSAMRREEPAQAFRRGLFVTLGWGVLLGFCGGMVYDLLKKPSGELPLAPFAVVGQVMISGLVGLFVGVVCRRLVIRRGNA